MLRERFRSANIACWDKWKRMFSNLRLLLSKTQFTSDITSKTRIVSKENIHGYILKKPKIRQKMRILNSLTVPRNVKGGAFCFAMISYFNVKGYGRVQNHVLSTYGKSAQCTKSGPIALN